MPSLPLHASVNILVCRIIDDISGKLKLQIIYLLIRASAYVPILLTNITTFQWLFPNTCFCWFNVGTLPCRGNSTLPNSRELGNP
uniref:Uncharacterized protein n=1 Tax=Glossina palpalis gambiensis TaxID=67801 RepID=A0A1B0B804_9MUSC